MRKIKLITTLSFLILLTGCTSNTSTDIRQDNNSNNSSENIPTETITFGDTITTDGNASIENNKVTISSGGNYTITGQSDDAELIIDASDQDVNLTLDNLTLTSSNTSAITGIDATNLTITLEGENTISDTENNTDDYQAPIYIDEIETHILGNGTLNLNGNYQEGFESNNNLYIDSGNINITAVDDGINAGDLLSINGGIIYINSNGDGIDSNGDLEITGGETYVSSGNTANGPIDYASEEGYTFTLTGGVIIGAGGNMGETPDNDDVQTFLTATSEGTNVQVGDYKYNAAKEFSYVFISYPELTEDTPILIDGQEVETSTKAATNIRGMGSREQGDISNMPPPTDMPTTQ